MTDDKRIRDVYSKHVGHVEAEHAAGDGGAPFVLLELQSSRRHGQAFATLGASRGPLQHELVMAATEPFRPYAEAIEAVVRAAPTLAPGIVVPLAVAGTRFTALLCLPLDDRAGSFALGRLDAPPYAFRLVPLTAPEQVLAEQDPSRAIDLLRRAQAFTVDRRRDCAASVPEPSPAARTAVALERRQTRTALLALQAKVLHEHGPRGDEIDPLPVMDGDNGAWASPGAYRTVYGAAKRWIREALEPYVRHPAPVVTFFAEFMYVTLATHPDAVRMIDRAVASTDLPEAASDLSRTVTVASRRAAESLAIAVGRFHPSEREEALAQQSADAACDALATFDPADEIPLPNHVWAAVLAALYAGVRDLTPPPVRGLPKVFRHVARNEVMLDYEYDPRPPLSRLEDIVRRLAIGLVTAYAAGLRGQLP